MVETGQEVRDKRDKITSVRIKQLKDQIILALKTYQNNPKGKGNEFFDENHIKISYEQWIKIKRNEYQINISSQVVQNNSSAALKRLKEGAIGEVRELFTTIFP